MIWQAAIWPRWKKNSCPYFYATDEWIEPEWDESAKPCDNRRLNDMQKDVDKWRAEKAHKSVLPRILHFLKHSLYSNPESQAEEETFRMDLETL